MQNTNQKFFLYVRKSTDVEDKQVLSIEAQLAELKAFAKREGIRIAEIFVEKKSAKIPGRKIFAQHPPPERRRVKKKTESLLRTGV